MIREIGEAYSECIGFSFFAAGAMIDLSNEARMQEEWRDFEILNATGGMEARSYFC